MSVLLVIITWLAPVAHIKRILIGYGKALFLGRAKQNGIQSQIALFFFLKIVGALNSESVIVSVDELEY